MQCTIDLLINKNIIKRQKRDIKREREVTNLNPKQHTRRLFGLIDCLNGSQ